MSAGTKQPMRSFFPLSGEGSPITILQAMAHGKPWLATPECGAANEHAGGIICHLPDFKRILAGSDRDSGASQNAWRTGKGPLERMSLMGERVVTGWVELIETGQMSKSFSLSEDIDRRNKALVRSAREPGEGARGQNLPESS